MTETIPIERNTVNRIHRLLNRIDIKLEHDELQRTVSEEQAAEFLGWSIGTLRNNVADGTIPANAIVHLVNGKKRFRLEKLIK